MRRGRIWILALLLAALLMPALAQAEWIDGRRPTVTTIFDDVTIDSTGADTTAWLAIGGSQYQTVIVAADSVGGAETVDIDITYELSRDGVNVAWFLGESGAKSLIAGFTGYDYTEYYKAVQIPMAIKMRFIATGTATNGAYTQLKMCLITQP